jgi:putative SOS response-associated peptidase YedK
MCGRVNISSSPLAELFLAWLDEPPGPGLYPEDVYNVAPTESVPVIRRNREGVPEAVAMRWWLTPHWSKEVSTKYSMFNAKAETLVKSRAFREPFQRRRCLVPVAGFYEWVKDGGKKLPYYIRPSGDDGLMLAGIWDRWRGPEQTVESFAVVTTAVNENLAFVHNRQPVLLDAEAARRWLDPDVALEDLQALLGSTLPCELMAIPVSTYVSNSRNAGPRCIEPIGKPVVVLP